MQVDEYDGPAWLHDPVQAKAILEQTQREHLFRVMTGYYDLRNRASDALKKIDPDCRRRDWVTVGQALKYEFGEEGWFLWDSWSSKGKKYDASNSRYQWDSFPTGRVKIGSLFRLARGGSNV